MESINSSSNQIHIASVPERISIVDALRGFALMGLLLIHCLEYFELYWLQPTPALVHDVVFFIFGGKAYAIFALLFGLSFFIIMERQAAKGINFSGRFVWRLVILFAIGYLHGLLYSGDILQVLALLGLILVVVNRIKNTGIFLLSIVFLLNIPLLLHFFMSLENSPGANEQPVHWALSAEAMRVWANESLARVIQFNSWKGSVPKWYFYYESGRVFQLLGLFMLGLLLGRISFFTRLQEFKAQRRSVLIGSLTAGVVLCTVQYFLNHSSSEIWLQASMAKWFLGQAIDGYLSLAIMLVLILLFVRVYETSVGLKVLGLLAPAGRMSLSIYVSQALICVPIYYGFGLGWYKTTDQSISLIFGALFFIVQLVVAHWWMKKFYYGPLEWLWRAATYMTTDIPFVKNNKILDSSH